MKQFTIPCKFGDHGVHPFFIYAGEPNPENHPLKYQAHWLRSERGGMIPKKVLDSMKKLQNIACRNHISFEELCVYALGSHHHAEGSSSTSAAASASAAAATPGVSGSGETIEEQVSAIPHSKGMFKVIHNPSWEKETTAQENEHAKLPDLRLVDKLEDAELDREPPIRKPNRKPKPGKDAASRYVPPKIADKEIQKYPFRYFYDWLRRCHMRGFSETQAVCEILVPKEYAEEFRLLLTIMLEEGQSVLNPHSFAETLDFLFDYDDIRYTLAVILDTGGQYMSRSTYWNLLDFYTMSKERLSVTRRSLLQCLLRFAELPKPTRDMLLMAPQGFDVTLFHKNYKRWFKEHPQATS